MADDELLAKNTHEDKTSNIVLEIDGKEVDDPKLLAEAFNNFFVDKVDGIVEECPPNPPKVVDYMVEFLDGKDCAGASAVWAS